VAEGLIHVYTGEGKGKTTAAVGLAVRAAGQGLKVCIVEFLKGGGRGSGEQNLISEHIPDIEFLSSDVNHPMFQKKKLPQATMEDSTEKIFELFKERAMSGNYDLIVLDEINNVIDSGYLRWDDVATFLQEKPAGLELVLTGREAHPQLQAMADYVTEMLKIKHPYDKGCIARRGIEY
jgi:cob(I)alamin adenosyltransferase